ncbi:MAG TPA: DUF5666 domain-containing protein [Vicinamibacteria bacterium]
MHRRHILSLLVLAAGGGALPALAHGGHEHVMGTVKSVDTQARKVEVTTVRGKVVTVLVDDKTKYSRGKAAASEKELAVGEKVVIDAGKENGQLVAREVRLPVK